MRQKLDEYFTIGVQQVWIVEPENRTVLVCHSRTDLRELGEQDTLVGEGVLDGFNMPVVTLFAS